VNEALGVDVLGVEETGVLAAQGPVGQLTKPVAILEDGQDVALLVEDLPSDRIAEDALVESLETVAGQSPDDLEDLGRVVGVRDAFSPVRGQAKRNVRATYMAVNRIMLTEVFCREPRRNIALRHTKIVHGCQKFPHMVLLSATN
jgi:hypothetical protein